MAGREYSASMETVDEEAVITALYGVLACRIATHSLSVLTGCW